MRWRVVIAASGFLAVALGAIAVAQPARRRTPLDPPPPPPPKVATCLDHATAGCDEVADQLAGHGDFDAAIKIGVVECNAKAPGACAHLLRIQLAACDANLPAGCYLASLTYHYGVGVRRDQRKASRLQAKALSLRLKACDAGDASSCTAAGSSYADGEGAAADPAKAAAYFQRGCDGGVAPACYLLGEQIKDRDRKRALALFGRGCDLRDAAACMALAETTTDVRVHAHALVAACDAGDGEACDRYDYDLRDGKIPGVSPAAATRELEARCDRNDATACDEAALRHSGGVGARRDYGAALVWWAKACERGLPERCGRVALYLTGAHAPPAALARAVHFLEIGCKAGESGDCDMLARVRARMTSGRPAAPRP